MASATLLRPFKMKKGEDPNKPPEPEKSQYEMQQELKARLRSMFESEELIVRQSQRDCADSLSRASSSSSLARCAWPRRANQNLGSPSNRIQLLARASMSI